MAGSIRWGILGAGNIAKQFARGLAVLPEAELAAVGSRSADKAAAFAQEFGATRSHGSYEALAADPAVDVIYVATPHPMHHGDTLRCLRAGKAVLCEKPFAVNAAQAREMIAVAREQRLFLMEAMWTRFLPAVRQVATWLGEGRIGEPRMLTADFGFRAGFNPAGRLFDPQLAGGSLLDVGVYCVSLAFLVFGGRPDRTAALGSLGETGVDEQAGFLLGYPGGELAVLSSAVRTNTPQEARIDGTAGRIRIDAFWHATRATLEVGGQPPETVELPLEGNGYNYQAAAVMAALRAGQTECAVMPLDETLAIAETLDALRAQMGVRYPME
ncbi:MAG: Gfo/Idh/MocA family oxidoreductase [Fimbriimonadaceae bacterium]|nr:Gfo/Idh/MocA family oxidoreductase [Fimbriimonadaceae bacterium]